MACRQWNPCTPCQTFVPYPCSSPCPCPPATTSPTGPNGPTSWVSAQLSATNGSVAVPTTATFVAGPWAIRGGNTDSSFSTVNGTYTAPVAGVYEITFRGSASATAAGTGSLTTSILVGGTSLVNQVIADTFSAGQTIPIGVTGVFSLKANDQVQVSVQASATPGFTYVSSVNPATAPTTLSVKSLF